MTARRLASLLTLTTVSGALDCHAVRRPSIHARSIATIHARSVASVVMTADSFPQASDLAPTADATPVERAAPQEGAVAALLQQLKASFQQVKEDPLQQVKEAGLAGGLSYFAVEVTFFAIALPVGYLAWHASTGEWLQPLVLLQEDGAEGKVRLLGLLLSYVVLLKTLFPLRLGSTLLLTPVTKRLLEGLPAVGGAAVERATLKAELLSLAEQSRGGLDAFEPEAQQRFDEVVAALSALTPSEAPARSSAFSGEWQCEWTTEKELNFAVEKGLPGCPWERTYQQIDLEKGTLENVIQFAEGSYLKVGSTIAPDADNGRRFNFAFDRCELRWRSIRVPLPPVGKGWGELLYLDEELRVQRDVRGDLLIASKVVPTAGR